MYGVAMETSDIFRCFRATANAGVVVLQGILSFRDPIIDAARSLSVCKVPPVNMPDVPVQSIAAG